LQDLWIIQAAAAMKFCIEWLTAFRTADPMTAVMNTHSMEIIPLGWDSAGSALLIFLPPVTSL
jgi:hypothetical protein